MNKDAKILADLIARQAQLNPDKTSMIYEEKNISFADVDRSCNKVVNGLIKQGGHSGDGLAIMMGNCPEFVYLFWGLPRGGFYNVPVNAALVHGPLRHLLTHSGVRYLVVDDVFYSQVAEIGGKIGNIEKIFIRRTANKPLPEGTQDLSELFDAADTAPEYELDPEAINHMLFTSGTTGAAKAVTFRTAGVKAILVWIDKMTKLVTEPGDVLYTYLPLFHANALLMTFGWSFGGGLTVVLDKKFSLSRFWGTIRKYCINQFNTVGPIVQFLMSMPANPDDADNPVRVVNTAACPKNLWEAFENRFGVKILESYSSVDGGGTDTYHGGLGPVGSVGKPLEGIEWQLVDDDGKEIRPGETGELLFKIDYKNAWPVEYYKNPEASAVRNAGGWNHSGDLFTKDENGWLFYVDRKGDNMRRRGENISSFEVESVMERYPAIEECAAFGVVSELGENEVMVWIKPKSRINLDLKDLMNYCRDNMAFYMIPRYFDVVDEMPRTSTTMRVTKSDMKKQGVTERTWDREKEMPEFKPKIT